MTEEASNPATVGIENAALPLDLADRVCLVRQGSVYRYIFRRINANDWDGFFARLEAELEQSGGTVTRLATAENATLWLFNTAIARAEGWRTSDGRALVDLPNWKERIPVGHRLAAGEKLMRVTVIPCEEGVLYAEGERVALKALWTACGDEGMAEYLGLVHRFATPSAEHRRRYSRAKSKAIIVGGSRAGRTLMPSTGPVLAKLYDELIDSVEGYSVAGRALSGREEIAREMDGFHKVAAARELFEARMPEEAEAAAA